MGPCAKAACVQRADTSVGPYRGTKLICILFGLRMCVACSGRGMPRPYNGMILCFGGVAIVGFVQRSRQASTLQRCRTCRLPCRGAPVCAPVDESGMYAAGRHIGRPLQGCKVDLYFVWVANVCCVRRAGHAPPLQRNDFVFWRGCKCLVRAAVEASLDPTKVPDDSRIQERSVTWRSDLFIDLTFTNRNMRIPGPGPQARCGKGVWSPEDQGDRCRVPRSFGPSGAGREQH